MSRIVVGWTWQQALAFLLAWTVVCGPWVYMVFAIPGPPG